MLAVWQGIVDKAVNTCLQRFSNLQTAELAVSLLDLSSSNNPPYGGYRQDELMYPASIVKLFYAVAAYHWLEQGKLAKSAEFDRAMSDMIVLSSNDATSYIVDLLTGTTSGPELSAAEMKQWSQMRNLVNDYFRSCNYHKLNINQKPWEDGPYGRERIFAGMNSENRNLLTTAAVARLLSEIVNNKAVLPAHCRELLSYMKRDCKQAVAEQHDQVRGFIGEILPAQAQFWSKAGWTSKVRHDAVYVELDKPDNRFVLVVFTENHAKQPEILQALASEIVQGVLSSRGSSVHG
jgi:beta-lactamase class A